MSEQLKTTQSNTVIANQSEINPNVLFIGNIPYSTSDHELITLFSAHGEVSCASVVRDEQERSRGFAFVRFVNAKSASSMLTLDTPVEFEGRKLRLSLARNDSRYIDLVAV